MSNTLLYCVFTPVHYCYLDFMMKLMTHFKQEQYKKQQYKGTPYI